MMLKVIFYSYAQGIYSSREMEDRMRWDPNYIYLSANQRVDHSTICNFILKYGEEIKAVFSRLVYVMAKMGYITMDFVAIDGTKIRADASMRVTGNVEEFRQQRDRIEENHAIVSAGVFNEVSDRGLLELMIEELRDRTGEDLSQTDIGVDAGYFSSEEPGEGEADMAAGLYRLQPQEDG
jgi:hypothetical protein